MKHTLILFCLPAFGFSAEAQTHIGTMTVDGSTRKEVKTILKNFDRYGDFALPW